MTTLPLGAVNSVSLDKLPPVSLETFQSFPFVQRPSFPLQHFELFSRLRSGEHSISSRLLPSSQRPRCWTGVSPGVIIKTAGMTFLNRIALVTPQWCQCPGQSLRSETVVGIIGPSRHGKPGKYLPRKELPHRGTPSGKASKPYRVESSHEWISGISQPGA